MRPTRQAGDGPTTADPPPLRLERLENDYCIKIMRWPCVCGEERAWRARTSPAAARTVGVVSMGTTIEGDYNAAMQRTARLSLRSQGTRRDSRLAAYAPARALHRIDGPAAQTRAAATAAASSPSAGVIAGPPRRGWRCPPPVGAGALRRRGMQNCVASVLMPMSPRSIIALSATSAGWPSTQPTIADDFLMDTLVFDDTPVHAGRRAAPPQVTGNVAATCTAGRVARHGQHDAARTRLAWIPAARRPDRGRCAPAA